MKKYIKYVLIPLILIGIILNIKIIKNEFGTYTILETIKHTYQAYTITLNENPYFESISAAVNAAHEGETIYVVGDFEIREDFEIPKGITVEIQSGSNISLAAGYTMKNFGTLKTNSATSLNVNGDLVLGYDSLTEITSTIQFFGETGNLKTEAIQNPTNEYATMILKDGSSFLGDEHFTEAFDELSNIKIENFGANITDNNIISLFHENNLIVSHGLHVVGTNTYYDDFNSIPVNAGNIELTTFLYLTEDQNIFDGITINIKPNKQVMIDGNLHLDATTTIKTNGNYLNVTGYIAGTGSLYLTPAPSPFEATTFTQFIGGGIKLYFETTPTFGSSIYNMPGVVRADKADITSYEVNANLLYIKTPVAYMKPSFLSYTPEGATKNCANANIDEDDKYNCYDNVSYYVTMAHTAFPNASFYECVVDTWYKDNNEGEERPHSFNRLLNDTELASIKNLNCSSRKVRTNNDSITDVFPKNITDVTGIENLTGLETLDLTHQKFTSINLSSNTRLKTVDLSNNDFTALDITNLTNLDKLTLNETKLEELKPTNNINLKELSLYPATYLNKLDLAKFPLLTSLKLNTTTSFTEVTFDNPKLKELRLNGGFDTFIGGTSGKTYDLEILYLTSSNLLTTDLSNLTNLKEINIVSTKNDYTVKLGKFDNLESVSIWNGGIPGIKGTVSNYDFSDATNLKTVYLQDLGLTEFKFNTTSLEEINLKDNNIQGSISITTCPKLKTLNLYGNKVNNLTIENCTKLETLDLHLNKVKTLDIRSLSSLKTLDLAGTNITTLNAATNENLTNLNLNSHRLTSFDATLFPSVTTLDMTNTITLDELDLRPMTNLTSLKIASSLFKKNIYLNTKSTGEHAINFSESSLKVNSGVFTSLTPEDDTLIDLVTGKNTKQITYQYQSGNTERFTIEYNYFIPGITSEKYDIEDNVIYIKTDSLDDVVDNVTITNGVGSINNSTLEIRHFESDEEAADIFNIIGVSSTLPDDSNVIELAKRTTIKEVKDTFTIVGDIQIKVYRSNDEELTDEDEIIKNGMKIKAIYNNKTYETYTFNVLEYLEITDITPDEETGLITNLNLGTKISDIDALIDTNGTVTYLDGNNAPITVTDTTKIFTGMTIKIELPSETIEYVVSIKGDVTGSGSSSISDVMRIVDHVLGGQELEKDCYINAADVNGDTSISISDVMYLVNEILG